MAPRRAAATTASKKITQSKGGTEQASTTTPKTKKKGTPNKSTPTGKVKKSTLKKKARPKKQATVTKAETEQHSLAERERVITEQFGDFVVYSFTCNENRAKTSVAALISLRVRHADTDMWKIYEDNSKLTKAEVARERKAGFHFPEGFVTRIQPWDHLV
jgi:hypothetical protein